jgi:hypothetical protein
MSEQQQHDKPTLHLIDTKKMTLDHVLNLFRKLTGREPTLEAIENVRRRWAVKRKPSLEEEQP